MNSSGCTDPFVSGGGNQTLDIGPVTFHRDASGIESRAPFRIDGDVEDVWFRVPSGGPVNERLDPFVPVALLAAMKRGVDVRLHGSVSSGLLKAIAPIQDLFAAWYPDAQRIRVEGVGDSGVCAPAGTAAFFSGGLDSWFTAHKHQPELDALIFVHGFDLPVSRLDVRERMVDPLRTATARFGVPLIEVETNLRTFVDAHARDWIYAFGSGLAAVALLLRPRFSRVFVPASETYRHMDPCGSHPLLDPLWGTDGLFVIVDGAEATRVDKAKALAGCEPALASLRVCWENRGGLYNCGQCEKCLRTLVELEIAGITPPPGLFSAPLDNARLAEVELPNELVARHAEENLAAAEAVPLSADRIAALRTSLRRYQFRALTDQIARVCAEADQAGLRGRLARRVARGLLRYGLGLR